MQKKSDLRRELIVRRAAAFASVPNAGERLVARFPAGIAIKDQIISAYMPLRTEIDPLPLLRALAVRGGQQAFPRINAVQSPSLTFHLSDPDNPAHFEPNKWGLLEPRPDLPRVTPTILLVPLLGFDRQGNRIGFGKGFYDNAIAALATTITIGIAFAQQEVTQIPIQPHDQRLDWIITQNEAYAVPS